ncbi:4-hydroxyphenylacetate decarboxylase large subunit [Clostridioides difficile]|uniref:4-hydroxyphenylacetate decarboxylase large subunit n=1 Tax=Clostridioides difficile TaxID=1496 RepID=UPI0008731A78|nr:4-hydroxyphenylacetate decarboxylase large subunit [Clostridioides difficile]AXU62952.1 4-hydroxyphenylacetate decarboxylase, catalytic subunit [Clostridioides difficile]EGT4034945.1 4-hydroxyphenylacetate decarboxylase large subunit [Clostridioides difficile]EGT5087747.1 MFS transporter [Clostridioides difficile]EGT5494098.1 MFS transporter [Clostridioides difficile]EJX3385178.1 4-hydroxyphenylacetate decarboxylase large subunit [Clostridioides difficile]
MSQSKEDKIRSILEAKNIKSNFQNKENLSEFNEKKASKRAEDLLDVYYNTLSTADMEFPYWYNREYRKSDGDIPVVRRAKALKAAFSHMTPNIIPGEKIVMQKTRHYRGSFPMPWVSESFFVAQGEQMREEAKKLASNTADELTKFGSGGGNVTESFGNVVSIAGKFGMRKEEVPVLVKMAKEWVGKSVEDLGFRYEKMMPDYDLKENLMSTLICMFDSGYTLPQGREVINYFYPLNYGLDGIIEMAKECKKAVAGNASGDGLIGMDRLYFYEAVIQVIEGLQTWILNYAKHAKYLESIETDLEAKKEYSDLVEILEHIAHKQPRTFREALQLTYTIHIASVNEDAISGMSIGRFGQILYPWYEQDIEKGLITKEEVIELLELYRIKITCIDCFASAGVNGGVLSGNTFNTLSIGGLKEDGSTGANELEELLLEASMRCRTPQPSLTMLYDEKIPEDFLMKAAECTKLGSGYPAWVNNSNGTTFMMKQFADEGMTVEEARAFALGGCLETSPGCWKQLTLNGKTYSIAGGAGQSAGSGVHFIANPKILELVLMNGKDHRMNIQVFEPHNKPLDTYEEVIEVFKDYYKQAINVLERANNIELDIWRKFDTSIINSLLKPDCLDKGQHIGNMGYRYNATLNVETCGTVTMVNSFAALKKLVYDDKAFTIEEMKDAILNNFGFKDALEVGNYSMADQVKVDKTGKYDAIYKACLDAPKYGNNDLYADNILKNYEVWLSKVCEEAQSLYAKKMYPCQISVSTHGPQGAATLATPDGRLSGTTYSDGSVSAYAGTDKNGVYALFESATIWDQAVVQNSQMNLKLHPTTIKGQQGTKKLLDLTRSYLRKGGFHIQYNVVDSETLKDAQKNPDNYRQLMVRVAGFTQYWCELGKPIQDEVIARTEYEGV